jgi:hypothetical protein
MAAHKPSVYLDTNIFSLLHYRGGDPVLLDQQSITRGWWELERRWFSLFTSYITEGELAKGTYPGKNLALAEVRRISFLSAKREVKLCVDTYLKAHVVPESKPQDAFQLAFATVHMLDYLLTWNHAHLASEVTQKKVELINRKHGWRTPLLVTPLNIPRKSFGQEIRRRNE